MDATESPSLRQSRADLSYVRNSELNIAAFSGPIAPPACHFL